MYEKSDYPIEIGNKQSSVKFFEKVNLVSKKKFKLNFERAL